MFDIECSDNSRLTVDRELTEAAKAFVERHDESHGPLTNYTLVCHQCSVPEYLRHDQVKTEAAKAFIELHIEECYEPLRKPGA